MSERETVIVLFRIDNGAIASVTESRGSGYNWRDIGPLTDPRDIEDAVARVVNTPVGGREDER